MRGFLSVTVHDHPLQAGLIKGYSSGVEPLARLVYPEMARPARPLTDKIIRDAMRGAGKRSFPLYDGHGLHLIDRGGRYHWRLKYARPDGRENRLALGHFPEVSLSEARGLADAARAKLRQGIDPAGEKKAARAAREAATERTFAKLAREWLAMKLPGWSPITTKKNKRAVEFYLLPRLGDRDVATIATSDVLPVIRETNKHSPEFARAAAGAAQNIVRYAIAEGKRDEGRLLDLDLRHNLPGRERGHNPAVTTPAGLKDVVSVVHDIDSPVTRTGLLMCCYTVQRPANVVGMRWENIDMKTKEWIIPAKVMKMRHAHIVPLPRQALALLKELQPLTGGRGYVAAAAMVSMLLAAAGPRTHGAIGALRSEFAALDALAVTAAATPPLQTQRQPHWVAIDDYTAALARAQARTPDRAHH